MALIILEPGEVFEHYHSGTSRTTLLEGRVRFDAEGKSFALAKGESVEVPAKTAHTLQNVGDEDATVNCSHG